MQLRKIIAVCCAFLSADILVHFYRTYRWVPEADYLMIPKPGSTILWSEQGFGISHWSKHGVRGQDLIFDKREILVVGDSFSEAFEMDDDEVYSHFLQDNLVKNGLTKQVLNIGTAGISILEHIGYAKRNMAVFQPSWTIVQVREEDFTSGAWINVPPRDRNIENFSGRLKNLITHSQASVDEYWRTQATLGRRVYNAFPFKIPGTARDILHLYFASIDLKSLFRPIEAKAKSVANAELVEDLKYPFPIREELDLLYESYGNRLTIMLLPEISFSPRRFVDSSIEQQIELYCSDRGRSLVIPKVQFQELMDHWKSPYGFSNGNFNQGHLNIYGHKAVAEALTPEIKRVVNAVF